MKFIKITSSLILTFYASFLAAAPVDRSFIESRSVLNNLKAKWDKHRGPKPLVPPSIVFPKAPSHYELVMVIPPNKHPMLEIPEDGKKKMLAAWKECVRNNEDAIRPYVNGEATVLHWKQGQRYYEFDLNVQDIHRLMEVGPVQYTVKAPKSRSEPSECHVVKAKKD